MKNRKRNFGPSAVLPSDIKLLRHIASAFPRRTSVDRRASARLLDAGFIAKGTMTGSYTYPIFHATESGRAYLATLLLEETFK